MPTYTFECPACGQQRDTWRTIARRNDELLCDGCKAPMTRSYTGSHGVIGMPDYVTDNITGEPVRIISRQQEAALCREHNTTPKIGKGWW